MKESMLRKLVLLLLLSTIVCILWAAGAHARKRVELDKSKELNEKLENLTLANTVITNNLKSIQNKIASLQQKEYELKNNLKEEEKAKEELRSKLQITKEGHNQNSKTLEELKNTNTTLGEELIRLKEKDLALNQELEQLKKTLEQNTAKKKTAIEANKNPEEKKPETSSSSSNFAW
ncbi:MAG: hypothetical protein V1747_08710 [Candidatus Omnitrophota bacterium]